MGRGELAGGPVSRLGVLMSRVVMPGKEGGGGAAQLGPLAWVVGLAGSTSSTSASSKSPGHMSVSGSIVPPRWCRGLEGLASAKIQMIRSVEWGPGVTPWVKDGSGLTRWNGPIHVVGGGLVQTLACGVVGCGVSGGVEREWRVWMVRCGLGLLAGLSMPPEVIKLQRSQCCGANRG